MARSILCVGDLSPTGFCLDANGLLQPVATGSVSTFSQNITTGVITHTDGDTPLNTVTANVVSTDADNAITVGSDGGAYLPNCNEGLDTSSLSACAPSSGGGSNLSAIAPDLCSTDTTDTDKYEPVYEDANGQLFVANNAFFTEKVSLNVGTRVIAANETNTETTFGAPITITVTNNTARDMRTTIVAGIDHTEMFAYGNNGLRHRFNYDIDGGAVTSNVHNATRLIGNADLADGIRFDTSVYRFHTYDLAACGGSYEVTGEHSFLLTDQGGFADPGAGGAGGGAPQMMTPIGAITIWGGTV